MNPSVGLLDEAAFRGAELVLANGKSRELVVAGGIGGGVPSRPGIDIFQRHVAAPESTAPDWSVTVPERTAVTCP